MYDFQRIVQTYFKYIALLLKITIQKPSKTVLYASKPKLSLYDDRSFIEYKGEENSKVVLHYVVERDGEEDSEYCKEEMNHLIGGIYIKSFILFYGEKIKYYITEEGPRSEKLTEASVLECPDGKLKGDMRYTNINAMAVSLAKGDNTQFCKLSEEYIKKTFLTNKLFAPDRGGE